MALIETTKSPTTSNSSSQKNSAATSTPILNQANSKSSASESSKEIKRISFSSSFGSLGKRSDEETYRNLVLGSNKKLIEQHNIQTQFTFKLGENQFSLLTCE